jgi:isopropylmalate/homocitrate/citramalate synthase
MLAMHNSDETLIRNLNTRIQKVFDNEKLFMQKFFETEYGEWEELLEFYMASERCRIAVLDTTGCTTTTTFKTSEILDWLRTI